MIYFLLFWLVPPALFIMFDIYIRYSWCEKPVLLKDLFTVADDDYNQEASKLLTVMMVPFLSWVLILFAAFMFLKESYPAIREAVDGTKLEPVVNTVAKVARGVRKCLYYVFIYPFVLIKRTWRTMYTYIGNIRIG